MYFPTTIIATSATLLTLAAAIPTPAPAWTPSGNQPDATYSLCSDPANPTVCKTYRKSEPGYSQCKGAPTGTLTGSITIAPGTMCKLFTLSYCKGTSKGPLWAGTHALTEGSWQTGSFQCMTISDWDVAIAAGGAAIDKYGAAVVGA